MRPDGLPVWVRLSGGDSSSRAPVSSGSAPRQTAATGEDAAGAAEPTIRTVRRYSVWVQSSPLSIGAPSHCPTRSGIDPTDESAAVFADLHGNAIVWVSWGHRDGDRRRGRRERATVGDRGGGEESCVAASRRLLFPVCPLMSLVSELPARA